MGNKTEYRFPLRLDDLTRWKIGYWYKQADCGSRNEFITKAVNFYADYLAGLENSILPTAVQSAIDGRLGMFEERIFRLLYKLTVQIDMGMSAVLDCVRVDDDYLRKLRADSVRNVKATNGLLPSGYMEYMAERPRSHGLFSDKDNVDMDAAMKELNEYPGNI